MAAPHDIPELDPKGLRQFAFTTGAIVVVLFGLALPWVFGFDYPRWPWILAAVLFVWGVVAPATLRPVYRGWMRFGLFMNKIVTPLILGIVYYLVITPLATVMRLRGRDPMARELSKDVDSYRLESSRNPVEKMERPY